MSEANGRGLPEPKVERCGVVHHLSGKGCERETGHTGLHRVVTNIGRLHWDDGTCTEPPTLREQRPGPAGSPACGHRVVRDSECARAKCPKGCAPVATSAEVERVGSADPLREFMEALAGGGK